MYHPDMRAFLHGFVRGLTHRTVTGFSKRAQGLVPELARSGEAPITATVFIGSIMPPARNGGVAVRRSRPSRVRPVNPACGLQSLSVRRSHLPVLLLAAVSLPALAAAPLRIATKRSMPSPPARWSNRLRTPQFNYEPRFQKPILY